MIWPLKYRFFQNKKHYKRRCLSHGQCFCTSSVTFVRDKSIKNFFPTDLTYYNDWQGFINFANKKNTRMVYLNKKLVGYRIYDKKINKKMIKEKENILRQFWNKKIIDFLYRKYHNKQMETIIYRVIVFFIKLLYNIDKKRREIWQKRILLIISMLLFLKLRRKQKK